MADANRQDPENLQNAERYQGGREPRVGRTNPPGYKDDTYDPSTLEVNLAREQGMGVGQKDLDYQRDATRAASAEQYGSPDAEPRGEDPKPGED